MTVFERLQGCPTGATYDALRLFHSDEEIQEAYDAGLVTTEIRDYAMPHGFQVEWFFAKEEA